MEKVRIGNDLMVNFSVYRNGEPESFDGATNISTKIANESYNKTIAHTYAIVDNVIQFNIDALELKQCGKCRVFISYTKVGDYTVDSPAFELVQYTEDTGGTEVIGIEIVKINISGDIGINRDGSSAYEVWEAYPGNEGKTIEQYFEWLHENPTKVDTSRTITAGNGLTGGGDLTEDRTINIGNTDDSIVVSADGIKVDTQDTLTSDSASKPLSAKQGKALQDNKAEKTRTITAGNGLTGGGDLSADRTINIANADDSLVVAADSVKVNTNNTLTSTSTTQPLSANQGKVLNEKVVQVETDLNYMYPSVGTSKRILADSGTIKSRSTLNELTNKFLDMLPNTKLLFCPHLAVKLRESGNYKYVTKLYDIGPGMLDGAQTTALSQPFLSGHIAPTEKYAIKNPNNTVNNLTHQSIQFGQDDNCSISTVLTPFGSNNIREYYMSGEGTDGFYISTSASPTFKTILLYASGTSIDTGVSIKHLIGKRIIITLVKNSSGLVLYINGQPKWSTATKYNISINRIFFGTMSYTLNGSISYHCIRDIALSSTQVQDEYNYLRTLFPEVESVQIGTQTWATSNCEMACTPQGNVIPEMQAASNIERVVNGGFESDTAWSKGSGWTISGGSANCDGTQQSVTNLQQPATNLSGKWVKLSFTISNYVSGAVLISSGGIVGYGYTSGNGTYSKYLFIPLGSVAINYVTANTNFIGSVDNVSIQEVGWSDLTNLYNHVYANTIGTSEQKEYAAVKAAAMWRNVNNDPALASVYGKKFNKYARKLLAMDIAYYNAANPTSLWGWDIPTQAQLTILASNGGNALKVIGTNYWNTANGINSTGLTLLGGGYIDANGNYVGNKTHEYIWCKDADIARVALDADNTFNEVAATTEGYSIRLIKV